MPKGKSASNQQFKGLCVCKPPFLEGTSNPNQNSWSLSKQPGLRRNLLGGVFCRSISLEKILDAMDGYLCRSLQRILVKTCIYIYMYTPCIYIPTTNTYSVHTLRNSYPLFMIHVLFHCFIIDLSIFHCSGLISINAYLFIQSFIFNHLNTRTHFS